MELRGLKPSHPTPFSMQDKICCLASSARHADESPTVIPTLASDNPIRGGSRGRHRGRSGGDRGEIGGRSGAIGDSSRTPLPPPRRPLESRHFKKFISLIPNNLTSRPLLYPGASKVFYNRNTLRGRRPPPRTRAARRIHISAGSRGPASSLAIRKKRRDITWPRRLR